MHGGNAFAGSASRYYRSNTVGAYVNDNYKMRSNLTVTLGLRWDFDGPLSEKYGKLTAFDPRNIVMCSAQWMELQPILPDEYACDPGQT